MTNSKYIITAQGSTISP